MPFLSDLSGSAKSCYLLLFAFYALFTGCASEKPTKTVMQLSGNTMGTTYHISYLDSLERNFQTGIDSLLLVFNKELSTYDSSSLLSRLNRDTHLVLTGDKGKHLLRNLALSQRIYKETNGWFNPTVKPLVNYWGFGYKEKRPIEKVDSAVVDSLLALMGMDKFYVENVGNQTIIRKKDHKVQLDVNAIAPGDAADVLGLYLESKGIGNYMVEIGGEVMAKGLSQFGYPWRIGINTPQEGASTSDFEAIIGIHNQGLATSGNYRSFYDKGGKRYTHTINPKTGYTESNSLLSATILAPTAAEADAYATACMAMGVDSAYAWALKQPHIEAYFIYADTVKKVLLDKNTGIEGLIR